MTLAQLRYLVAIVDARLNMTLAAERLHATQSALSKQIKVLEESLGLQLFVRRGRSLESLSVAGEAVADRARKILVEADNIRALAANHRHEATGELVIAATQTQARFFLPPALQRLKAAYPGVKVRLNLFGDPQGARLARQGADLTIASAIGRPDTGDVAIPLYRWDRVAVVPQAHPLARSGQPVSLARLARFPLIGYETALGSQAEVAAAFARAGSPAQFAYTAHDAEVIKTYVRASLGVGLLGEMALTAEDEDLTRLRVEGLPTCTAYALLGSDRVERDYVVSFVTSSPRN